MIEFSGDLESKNTNLLNEIATRFEAYQADVMYRFKSFDKYSADINLLEEQLRVAWKKLNLILQMNLKRSVMNSRKTE